MDEAALVAKLKLIEALFAGAKTPGERSAAGEARERIRARLGETERVDQPIEYKFRMADAWSRRLFVALLRRYEIRPYRYKRQRHTTVMAKVSASFVDEILWPQFTELDRELRSHLGEVTDRIVSQAVHDNCAEAEEIDQAAIDGPG